MSEEAQNFVTIEDAITAVRAEIGGLEAKKGGGAPYAVKSAKELSLKFATALNKVGGSFTQVANAVRDIKYETIENRNGKLEMNCWVVVELTFEFRVGGLSMVMTGLGGGHDNGDKAIGKAATYAWKNAVVQGFTVADATIVDTDDEHKPVETGGRVDQLAVDALKAKLDAVTGKDEAAKDKVRGLIDEAKKLNPATMAALAPAVKAAVGRVS